MSDSELATRRKQAVTNKARAPRTGVWIPNSTPSSWHSTSKSTTSSSWWALARVLAVRLASLTPSWSAWPSPRSCSSATPSAAGCGSRAAGSANYGYCASHSRFFWGLRLHLLTTPDGAVVAWVLANPKLGDREVAEAMLEHSPLRPGLLIIADKGYAGQEFEDLVRE